jgi:serine protease Do
MKVWRRKMLVTLGLWIVALFAGYMGYQYFLDQQYAHAQEQREELRQGMAKAEDLSTAFRNVGKLVEPSVVNIEVRKKAPVSMRRPFNDDFLRRFFPDRNGDGEPDLPPGLNPDDGEDGGFDQIGTGSGVIMEYANGKGYILTNNHVAGGAEELDITLSDGRRFKNGKVLGADAKTDLAVVEIQADRLVSAKWGNSDELRPGDWIMAFGSPFGYVGSMTHGIVSAIHRTNVGILGSGGYENFIQVDAPINPGNSGGPLVNLLGEVVGVNTAIASRSGGFQGIGFAIPSNQAKFIYQTLKTKGKVVRGWLGVGINDVAKKPQLAKSFGYKGDNGVLVEEVIEGTPATGKLKPGDIITKVNGKVVDDVQELRNAIAQMAPGTDVTMTVFRAGKTSDMTIKLGEQPENVAAVRGGEGGGKATPQETSALESLGLRVTNLTPEIAQKQGVDVKNGVIISDVSRNSPSAKEGLRRGDVITEVGNTQVKNVDDLNAAIKKEDLKKGVRLYVTSREGSRFVFLTTEK